jgi:hypothetical protein
LGKGPKAPSNTLPALGGLASGFGNTSQGWMSAAAGPYKSATDFWSGVLSGNGTGGQQLVAPSAQQIGQVYSGNAKTLQNFMPAGGERNLALSQNQLGKASSIAGLYNNVQPYAAQQLANLAGLGGQIGTGTGQLATAGFGDLTAYQGQQNAAKGASMGGIGSGLGKIFSSAFLGPVGATPWIFG